MGRDVRIVQILRLCPVFCACPTLARNHDFFLLQLDCNYFGKFLAYLYCSLTGIHLTTTKFCLTRQWSLASLGS